MPLKNKTVRRYRKKRIGLAPKTRKAVTTLVKRQINKKEESKFIYQTVAANTLVSNLMYLMSPIQAITQGTGNGQRIGNSIMLQRLTLKFLLQNKLTYSQVNLRVIVFWSPDLYTAGWNYSSNAFPSSDIFLQPTSNVFNALIDYTQSVNVIADYKTTVYAKQVINFSAGSNTAFSTNQVSSKRVFSLHGKKVIYQSGTNFLNNTQLYVMVIPNCADTASVQGSSQVAALDMQALVSYKDA